MKNVKLTIEYDGTGFHGWQRQDHHRTVQEEVEKALEKIIKKRITIHGSGRTDAGVHGLGQVASFKEDFTIPIDKIPLAVNALLPDDVAIRNAEEVSLDFHARYSAVGKRYIYKIYNRPLRSPLQRNYAYFVPTELNLDAIKKASSFFIGEHDFKAFMASGSSIKDTVRRIHRLHVYQEQDMLTIEVEGNGFLYNMVRIMAGTLVDIGKSKISPENIPQIISSGDRTKAGHTAPPQGLYLAEVYYG
ncbi:tRNA pseudouridine38-40 synthase [Anaerosolibacter carboniphilus]|uniref:tRNA pseudouridine synthase A n=1 Tax=Anaerosolibacter carboniphilus TaxID=1417629 RepID=A0A841KTU7_9FIRM|nr:tRNA pseudouridine(38-40) synthase TruA [Anaerosolibacter carboniphilus]MBB6216851.1 tRNA pseudouridine38-40 synthase [Anaerosolibacter carboniphilus]